MGQGPPKNQCRQFLVGLPPSAYDLLGFVVEIGTAFHHPKGGGVPCQNDLVALENLSKGGTLRKRHRHTHTYTHAHPLGQGYLALFFSMQAD